ncbi:30S ribosomal protein S6 [Candidatus Parcubacteria bacterium]|nr:30S ribosomal protein S6 [Candidatus Parcubacteria bacterium]
MPDTRYRPYELVYLLSGNLEEDAAVQESAKIAKIIQDAGGIIEREETSKRRRLAYEIKHEKQAYFGVMTVTATADVSAKLKEELRHQTSLLRYLLVQQVRRPTKPSPARLKFRPAPAAAVPTPQPEGAATPRPKEATSWQDFDKKLEEILQSWE